MFAGFWPAKCPILCRTQPLSDNDMNTPKKATWLELIGRTYIRADAFSGFMSFCGTLPLN
jgi:hypothetical protein